MPNLQKKRLLIFEIFNIKKCILFFLNRVYIFFLMSEYTGGNRKRSFVRGRTTKCLCTKVLKKDRGDIEDGIIYLGDKLINIACHYCPFRLNGRCGNKRGGRV